MLAFAAMFVFLKTADKCFIHFDCLAFAAHGRAEMTITHCFAKSVGHEPCRFVLDLQGPVQLMCADAFLAAGQQMSGLKPFVQFDMAALENRSNRNCKFSFARPTAPQTSTGSLDRRNPIKATTAWAMRATWPYDCFEPRDSSGFVMEMGLR